MDEALKGSLKVHEKQFYYGRSRVYMENNVLRCEWNIGIPRKEERLDDNYTNNSASSREI